LSAPIFFTDCKFERSHLQKEWRHFDKKWIFCDFSKLKCQNMNRPFSWSMVKPLLKRIRKCVAFQLHCYYDKRLVRLWVVGGSLMQMGWGFPRYRNSVDDSNTLSPQKRQSLHIICFNKWPRLQTQKFFTLYGFILWLFVIMKFYIYFLGDKIECLL